MSKSTNTKKLCQRMKGELLLRSLLPIELTNGNAGRGSKWFSSAKLRNKIEYNLMLLGHTREPFDVSVIVCVTRLLGKGQRLWDSSSLGRGNWKEIEDALVSLGWFHDDSPKYIISTEFRQDGSVRNVPEMALKTMVEIYEAEPQL